MNGSPKTVKQIYVKPAQFEPQTGDSEVKKMHILSIFAGFTALGMSATSSPAAVLLTGTTYSQNFDAFWGDLRTTAAAAGSIAWTNDATVVPVGTGDTTATLDGWYAYVSGGTSQSAGAPASLFRTNGFTSPQPFYLWRSGATTSDIAFGSMNFTGTSETSTGYNSFGFALTNGTGETINEFHLSYQAEKWATNYASTPSPGDDVFSVSFAIGAIGVADADGTWTDTSLGFAGTYPTASDVATWDITPTNVGGVITGITWNPGETLFIRWKDINISGTDRGMAIDNVVVTVPEPASLGLFGLAVAGLIKRRRRD